MMADPHGSALDLSLKCRLTYGRPHDPCSGTTDTDPPKRCGCWCHPAFHCLICGRVAAPFGVCADCVRPLVDQWLAGGLLDPDPPS